MEYIIIIINFDKLQSYSPYGFKITNLEAILTCKIKLTDDLRSLLTIHLVTPAANILGLPSNILYLKQADVAIQFFGT